MTTEKLKFGGLEIRPPLFLAPMAGLTHTALWRLLMELGGVGCLTTEMLSAKSLRDENTERSPYLLRTEIETPLSYQLLASTPEEIAEGVKAVRSYGAESVDMNFGCPAPAIRRRGGGSKLMENLANARALVAAARSATEGPLTAKIRLGEKLDEAALQAFCRMLEGEGVDLIFVHARLRGEPYGRKPRWEWVGMVKEWVGLPVVANGSINSVGDARQCLKVSGADGLMIGRAAASTPWVFNQIAREVYGLEIAEAVIDRPAIYHRFLELMVESFDPERRLGRIKEFTHYYATNYPFGHTLASRVQSSDDVAGAIKCAEEFFRRSEPEFEGWEGFNL
jgi:nifR3 family TIM-barrel protein